jgi:hypothetical protein
MRRVLVSLLAVLAGIALAQSTWPIGPNDRATGTIPTLESRHAYVLDLPAGVGRLEIEVDGEGQDADLEVFFGGDEVFSDTTSATTARYVSNDPSAGRYRIEVLNLLFQELSYTLTVSTDAGGASTGPRGDSTGPGGASEGSLGTPGTMADRGAITLDGVRESLASASGAWQTYRLRVPFGTRAFTVRLDAGGLDVDLAVAFQNAEIYRDVSTSPYPEFRLPEPAEGTYLLSVRSGAGRDAPYRIWVDTATGSTAAPPPEPAPPTVPSKPGPATEAAPAGSDPAGRSGSAWRHDFAPGDLLGWSIENGSLSNPGRGGPGGGGYLYADTPSDSAVGYFVAPAELLGDWSSLASLEIVLRLGPVYEGSIFGPYDFDGVGDVLLMSGSRSASYAFTEDVSWSWGSHRVALDDPSRWRLGGGAQSLADVLGDVTAFAVRAEYVLGHADAGLASVEAFGGGAAGAAGPAGATHDRYATAAATCRTRAEDGVFGDLREGERIVVTCPAGCSDGLTIWGDGIYTDDSAICRAAIHAGRVPGDHPFSVLLTILPGQARYEGVERHGIESRSYPRWPRSFAFGLGPFGEDDAR